MRRSTSWTIVYLISTSPATTLPTARPHTGPRDVMPYSQSYHLVPLPPGEKSATAISWYRPKAARPIPAASAGLAGGDDRDQRHDAQDAHAHPEGGGRA